MSSSDELLRREELIEQASLDALGLLDEFEAAHYARSFHAAPASVQEEVRRIQAAVATDGALLADEQPAPDLRDRVLGAVQAAVDEEARQLKPIATIGSRAMRRDAVDAATAEAIERERMNLRLQMTQRTVSLWRAASVGLAASLVAALVWVNAFRSGMDRIEQLVQNNATAQQVEEALGVGFRALLNDPNRVVFSMAASDPAAFGAVFHITEDDTVFIVTLGLVANESYTVRAVTGSGNLDLGTFMVGPGVSGCRLASADLRDPGLLGIEVRDRSGKVVMKHRT